MRTSNNYFTIDFVAKRIYGTKASFAKAGKGFGDAYEQLTALLARHPDFALETKSPVVKADKETYSGLTIDCMRQYLLAKEMNDALTMFDQIKANAESLKFAKDLSFIEDCQRTEGRAEASTAA